MIKNKTLLIIGGTVLFGNAVLKLFMNSEIKEIRIFSRDEKKQDDMRRNFSSSKIKFCIDDVRDINSLDRPIYSVDFVFHAAALKQVPSSEFFTKDN
jgi:UDP-N-acetylglucosamine 4,6-dehydratase/5-epimerase